MQGSTLILAPAVRWLERKKSCLQSQSQSRNPSRRKLSEWPQVQGAQPLCCLPSWTSPSSGPEAVLVTL